MKIKTQLFVMIGVTVIGFLFYKYIYDGTTSVFSSIDNKYYNVRRGNDKEARADILAVLYGKFKIIVTSLENDPKHVNKANVQRLIKKWKSGISVKEIGNMESDAAYVINKQNMSFCLQKSKNEILLEELNLITYVAIHELAHIMSVETDHGAEFIMNFEFLLNYAKNLVYYDPFFKKQIPLYIQLNKLNTSNSYCGVRLENSVK